MTINDIIDYCKQEVCKLTQIKEEEIISRSRRRDIVDSRAICFFILYMETNMTLKRIGYEFGLKDHSTVINGKQIYHQIISQKIYPVDEINRIRIEVRDLFQSWNDNKMEKSYLKYLNSKPTYTWLV